MPGAVSPRRLLILLYMRAPSLPSLVYACPRPNDRVWGLVANERDVVNRFRFVDTTGVVHSIANLDELEVKDILDKQAHQDNTRVVDNKQASWTTSRRKCWLLSFPPL